MYHPLLGDHPPCLNFFIYTVTNIFKYNNNNNYVLFKINSRMFNNYYLFCVNKHTKISLYYHKDPLIIIAYFICVRNVIVMPKY